MDDRLTDLECRIKSDTLVREMLNTEIGKARQIEQAVMPEGAMVVPALIPKEFAELAKKRYGVTPEALVSIAAIDFMRDAPETLNVASGAALNEQDCDACPARFRCSSLIDRVKEKLICFEKLVGFAVPLGAGLLVQLRINLDHVLWHLTK